MIFWPALAGGALAGITGGALWRFGALHRPGLIGLLLIGIAGFWPLFAVAAQDDGQLALHLGLFALFGVVAYHARRFGLAGLAIALLAHGVLDGVLFVTGHPGPSWWPAFCAAYDLTLAALLLASLPRQVRT